MALRPTRRCSTCGKVTAMWHLHTCSPVTAPTPERRVGEAETITVKELGDEAAYLEGRDFPRTARYLRSAAARIGELDFLCTGARNANDANAREVVRLNAIIQDWENREAAVCPEDFGFEEVIAQRDKDLARLTAEVERLTKAVKLHADGLERADLGYFAQSLRASLPTPAPELVARIVLDGEAVTTETTPAPEARADG